MPLRLSLSRRGPSSPYPRRAWKSPRPTAPGCSGLDRLRAATAKLQGNPLLPDVLIYQEAVRYALQYNEFFNVNEVAKAKVLLAEGEERAQQLAAGQAPWTAATGLVVRGYISKIDKSVQPYGLVVAASFTPNTPHRWRLDTWFHGRTENLSEVNFLADRERNPGEFTPRDTIVLHLYGRFCNASKLAGEVDFFEALDDVKRHYQIDDNRILIRGFSMGGASAWHIGTHFAGLWAAVADRAPASANRRSSCTSSSTAPVPRPHGSRRCTTSTTSPVTPATCSTRPPSPTTVKSTRKSRPPT